MAQSKAPKRRLGRGLGSLLSAPVEVATVAPASPTAPAAPADGIDSIGIDRIRPNPFQPRQDFDETAIAGLADSIRTAGVMQPIVVRPAGSDGYELVAGERRWRAARLAGLATIPAIVRALDDRQAAEWALIENVQREDLNPIERAEAFKRLTDEYGMTHQAIAEAVGLERPSVSNLLRLLELDTFCRDAVRQGTLGLGHARSLLAITSETVRRRLAERAIADGWSVRELERRVRTEADASTAAAPPAEARSDPRAAHTADLERRLGEHLGTKVHLQLGRRKGRGRLVIEFYDLDQFDGLLARMGFRGD